MPAKVYRTWEECVKRYPRLTALIMDVLIASAGEAGCCIRDHRLGQRYSCSAVSHSGLSPTHQIKRSLAWRKTLKQHYPESLARLRERAKLLKERGW